MNMSSNSLLATDQLRPLPALITVVLPAFNEARNLADLLPELTRRLTAGGQSIELLVVDDGSQDDGDGKVCRPDSYVR